MTSALNGLQRRYFVQPKPTLSFVQQISGTAVYLRNRPQQPQKVDDMKMGGIRSLMMMSDGSLEIVIIITCIIVLL